MSLPITLLPSVHDVMPGTLSLTESIVAKLERSNLQPVTLLVVPGLNWQPADLARLRELSARGHELAGHGWVHAVDDFRDFRHRLHGLLLSRKVAEHLATDSAGIARLISACRAWFDDGDLPAPTLYVPPAWAMGSIELGQLRASGFRYFESLTGFYDAETGRMLRVPLLGFEADTHLRAIALRISNALNLTIARRTGIMRLAIHPQDTRLLLRSDLEKWLDCRLQATSIEQFVQCRGVS